MARKVRFVTSGTFHSIPIDSITINREERQRREIDDIEGLAASIRAVGLINPPVVTRDGTLLAGERRVSACRALGWTHVSVQFSDEVDPATLVLIELEENIRRKDITWQERTLAVEKYHQLKRTEDPTWTQSETAKALNASEMHVSDHLKVAREIASPLVREQATFKSAIAKAQEVSRRRDDSLLHPIRPAYDTQSPVLTTDFIEWSAQPRDKFNFLHCDFPYGINYHNAPGQSASNTDRYLDTPDTYWTLFKALATNLDNFCAPAAHIIFWFSPNLYCPTWEMLKLLDGFTFEEHPLVWHRPGEGIAPDPQRRPRRVYEMAFFGWRGDVRINTVRDNCFAAPTERQRHPHEKSQRMLEHFFGMFVDEHTRLLDPTCGSGSSLRAGLATGTKTVFGIEQNEEFADVARRSLEDPSN